MRTLYKILLGFIPLLFTASAVRTMAQTPQFAYTSPTGSGNAFPLSSTTSNKVQWVYVPSAHFPTASIGLIDTIYFRVTTAVTSATFTNLTVKLGPTTLSQFTGTGQPWVGGLTTVYSAASTTISGVAANGWFALGLTTPYLYDPGQNLIVEMSQTSYTSGITVYQESSTANPGARQWGNVLDPTSANSGTGRVNFGFDLLPPPPCTSPPTAGTTLASATTVCSGSPVYFNLSGNSIGGSQTYQLLSASTAAGPYTAAGTTQTSAAFLVNPTASAFYRVRVVCGTGVDTSTAVQVTVPALFPGGTYTINNAQPTSGTNFNNFSDAVSAISCGITGPVTFNVVNNATPYTDQVTIPDIATTSATNTITFNGNGATIAFTATNSGQRAAFSLTGADWIRIRRLNIVATPGASNYGYGVSMTSNANNNIVDSCNITVDSNTSSTFFAGITISGSLTSPTTSGSDCDSNTITNNTINGGYYGITVLGGTTAGTGSQGNLIQNNVLRNFGLYGIYTAYIGNTIIAGNDISRPTRNNYTTFYGIYLLSTTAVNQPVRIMRNRIHDPSGNDPNAAYTAYGIFHSAADATAAAPHEVSNNLIYNMRFNGILYGLYNSSSDQVKYWHNTIAVNDPQSTNSGITRGFYQLTSATGIDLRNNIFSMNRGGTGIAHGIYWGTAATTFTASNNVYHVPNPGASGGIAYYNSVNNPTLAAYQTASSQEAGSLDADPLFAAPASNNFAATNALVNNAGTPLTQVTTDINGTPRSITMPDPGAIEFTPGPCTTPPIGGTAIASDTVICSGATIYFDVVGNSFGNGQTYQWQTAATPTGPWTNVGTAASVTSYSQTVTATTYFRILVTCGASTGFSTVRSVVVTAPLAGGTYTINAGAPASATNFQSFGTALEAMECGVAGPVVFNVVANSGPYTEQVIFPPTIAGTSATNTITINGNGNVIAPTTTTAASRAGILIRGADWIRLNNLTVNMSASLGSYGFGIHLIDDADNNIVRGCTINIDTTTTSSLFAGMVISGSLTGATSTGSTGCDSNQFLNNTVNGGYYGMTNVGSSTLYNYNNVYRGNFVRNQNFYGIYGYYTDNWVVDSNEISRPSRTNVSSLYPIALSTGARGTMVSRNRIHTPFGLIPTTTNIFYGLYTSGDGTVAQPNVFSNNLIYNVVSNGSQYGIYNSSSDNTHYLHNTFSLDDTTYAGSALTYGLYQTTAATGIDVRNNIFSLRRTGSGNRTALYFNTATTTFTSNYNNLYVNGGGTGTNNIGYLTSAYSTLSAWQTGTGKDTASIDLDPMFAGGAAGAASGNLTPTNVALDNIGQPIGVTTDAFGNPRSLTTPDIGAIEWSWIPPCAVPTALSDAAAATSATLSWAPSTSPNVGYEYSLSTTPTTPTGAGFPAPSSPVTQTGLAPSTTYYWFVRTVCGPTSYSGWVMDSFTTCTPPASALVALGSPTPTTAIAICQGDTAQLKASGGTGNTYLFLLNGAVVGTGAGPDSVLLTTQPGNYRVVVTNATGCYDTSALGGITVTVNPLPTPSITQTAFNVLSTTTFTTYQWNLAGTPISGATQQTYTAPVTGNGTYTVTVTDANGCRATSAPYNLTTASVASAAGAAATVRIFPNPTSGRVFIESSVALRAQLWTVDGRKLLEVEKASSIDLSALAPGVYTLRLTDENGTLLVTERITKTN